jgi:hypothetical protein
MVERWRARNRFGLRKVRNAEHYTHQNYRSNLADPTISLVHHCISPITVRSSRAHVTITELAFTYFYYCRKQCS